MKKNVGTTGPRGELGCMAPTQIFEEILPCLENEDFATLKENSLAHFALQRKKDLIKLWLKSLLNRTIIYYSNIYIRIILIQSGVFGNLGVGVWEVRWAWVGGGEAYFTKESHYT